jgi:serine/threonine protein phosphatase PrpC
MNQEDAEIVMSTLDTPDSALYAVFDGHGGDIVSKFAMAYFPQELKKNKD